ncbi:MAG: helix-turn-helix transcriptional regulator [Acidimicrobiaceae bacterium]|nr:helix-turn-helix transcriptional regulator [Acidimicrobiaceae bacterium]MXZ64970.1 helix-turn-helix transcriptional regulator [Acidimicrobiaceae bacterium]MYF33415.1 helix-turn-helix transcriptional regulator [Acidimicrobiaceae bacterium]MYG78492.1 helix-turn-helix transcriptional regulator [Acidimicrobiaceae bacterium]MYJ30499.1 helix-turn-helix transcriptional regulator [Acidimicrobiaceae bacterium]
MQANPHPVEALGSDLRESGALSRVFLRRRCELGLTQRQVADACEVSVQWLSEFENAKGDFGVVRLMRVAAALGLSLAVHPRPVTDIDLVFEQLGATGQPA